MSLILDDIGLTYSAGSSYSVTALQGVDLRVEPGELTLVVGATGSGKSTLLRIAAGLLAPTAGRVSIDDAPLSAATARGAVGLVFQDAESQLFADTLEDDVAFGPRNLGLDPATARQRAREALETVGLAAESFGSRSPFTLSGGEARRAAIAGVIAMRPRYLLADEPTAGLDARGRSAIVAVLRDALQSTGIVVVSHTAEEFLPLAHRVVMLDAGQMVFAGPPAQVIEDPSLFEQAGLVAPDVLQVQLLARRAGLAVPAFDLDPAVAAQRLVSARTA